MTYTLTVTLDTTPDEAETRIREALAEEGFGILSEIDIQAKLQEKLGHDIGTYKVLGACNPPLADQAIKADKDIGALLPCNVVIRANADGGTDIVAADPEQMLAMAASPELGPIAKDAKSRIERALATVSA